MMTDDMVTICERWERQGFENGFRVGVVITAGVALAAALVGWFWK